MTITEKTIFMLIRARLLTNWGVFQINIKSNESTDMIVIDE